MSWIVKRDMKFWSIFVKWFLNEQMIKTIMKLKRYLVLFFVSTKIRWRWVQKQQWNSVKMNMSECDCWCSGTLLSLKGDNTREALFWFQKAANNGDEFAQYAVGLIYLTGTTKYIFEDDNDTSFVYFVSPLSLSFYISCPMSEIFLIFRKNNSIVQLTLIIWILFLVLPIAIWQLLWKTTRNPNLISLNGYEMNENDLLKNERKNKFLLQVQKRSFTFYLFTLISKIIEFVFFCRKWRKQREAQCLYQPQWRCEVVGEKCSFRICWSPTISTLY